MAPASEQTLTLIASDGGKVSVSVAAAKPSKFITTMIEDDDDDELDDIPLHEMHSDVLRKVCDFLDLHEKNPMNTIPKPLPSSNLHNDKVGLQPEYANFIDIDQGDVIDIINAANYLDIEPLLSLGCAKMGSFIKKLPYSDVVDIFKHGCNESTPANNASSTQTVFKATQTA